MLEKRIGVIMYQTSNSKGQELVAQRMVRDFLKLGQKAYLITGTYHDGVEITSREGLLKNKGYYYIEDESLHIPVIRVESSVAKWPPRRVAFKEFISTLNQIVDDFGLNVLITHSTLWNGPEEVAKFVAWRRDMRKIGGYQDPIVFCHMSHFQEPSAQRYSISELTYRTAWNKISLSKILESVNLLLVVSPFERQAKIQMGAKPESCLLYPGGIDTEVFLRYAADDTSEFRKKHHIAPDKRIVSYLGTLEDRKNPLAVLKVAQKLLNRNDVHFVLAGRGDSIYAQEVIKTASCLPNVSYIGEVDDREKALLIRASYLNILLSKLEALGISQMEFMYGGVPVVTSGVGGQAWVVRNGMDGLHVKGPNDIDGAAEAITRLVIDQRLYRQMSFIAREKAGKYASINLAGELDSALNKELMKESGLVSVPEALQDTLSRTECVLKSWSVGTSGIVATNRHVFIRRGIVSKSVLSMAYRNIKAIEHMRRYPWKIPVVGAVLSGLASLSPFLQRFFAPDVVNDVKMEFNRLQQLVSSPQSQNHWFPALMYSVPFLISLIIFLVQARTGFRLYSEGTQPVYLSGSFRHAIEFIRHVQEKYLDHPEETASHRGISDTLIDSAQ